MPYSVSVESVAQRYAALHDHIASLAGDMAVKVVAVTKTFGADAIEAAVACGVVDIGESYAQECVAKLSKLTPTQPKVHFIGRLQRNKVQRLADYVDVWQTVDRPKIVREISNRAPGADVMIQVNTTQVSNQGGCHVSEVENLASLIDNARLNLVGLMTIGAYGDNARTRKCFQQLRRMTDALQLPFCSMGMTGDIDIAVSEGANMVRVGRRLFGQRFV